MSTVNTSPSAASSALIAGRMPEIVVRPGVSPSTLRGVSENSTMNRRGEDTVQVSDEARRLSSGDDSIRLDRVLRIRAQIQAGTYETDIKSHLAADRLTKALAAMA